MSNPWQSRYNHSIIHLLKPQDLSQKLSSERTLYFATKFMQVIKYSWSFLIFAQTKKRESQ